METLCMSSMGEGETKRWWVSKIKYSTSKQACGRLAMVKHINIYYGTTIKIYASPHN